MGLFLNQLLIIQLFVNSLISVGEVVGHRDFAYIDKRRIQGIIEYLLLNLLIMEEMEELSIESLFGTDPTDDELESIIEEKLGAIISESIKEKFSSELSMENLISSVRTRIGLEEESNPIDEIDLDKLIETLLINWKDELHDILGKLKNIFESKMESLKSEFPVALTKSESLDLMLKTRLQYKKRIATNAESEADLAGEAEKVIESWKAEVISLMNEVKPVFKDIQAKLVSRELWNLNRDETLKLFLEMCEQIRLKQKEDPDAKINLEQAVETFIKNRLDKKAEWEAPQK